MRDAWTIDQHALGRAEPKPAACETTSAAKVAPVAVFARDTRDSGRRKRLCRLLKLVALKHDVKLFGFASSLNFNSSKIKELSDYEKGYVKEGVGAGGMSLLANLKGYDNKEIVSKCELTIKQMKEVGQIP